MKDRILTGWTIPRAFYLLMGIVIIIQAIISRQWPGFILGAYFGAMGLFAFGCASGNCFGNNCATKPTKEADINTEDIEFEEIKSKK